MGPDVQTNSLIPAVYIHIPFCLTKCGYCSFYSVPYSKPLLKSYYLNLCREIDLFQQIYKEQPDSIYFGGGTPSLMTATQIQSIIEKLNPASETEITLEANPIQITSDWIKALSYTKVNRLSLGLQSMDNINLTALGRRHTAETMPARIRLCRDNGFNNISLDLMYGLPGSTNEDIETDLTEYLRLSPEHISTYLLSIDDDAPFKHWQADLPEDANAEKQYYTICETLIKEGFKQYELSNFAKEGYLSRHNLHYWLGDSYLGLGAGASGFINNIRYHKPDDLKLWEESIADGDILLQTETETLAQQKADFIIMQLRLLRGLELDEYKFRFGTDFALDYQYVVECFIKSGHLQADGKYIRLSDKAKFVSNSIFREFV